MTRNHQYSFIFYATKANCNCGAFIRGVFLSSNSERRVRISVGSRDLFDKNRSYREVEEVIFGTEDENLQKVLDYIIANKSNNLIATLNGRDVRISQGDVELISIILNDYVPIVNSKYPINFL